MEEFLGFRVGGDEDLETPVQKKTIEDVSPYTATHSVGGFEEEEGNVLGVEVGGGGETSEAGSYDNDTIGLRLWGIGCMGFETEMVMVMVMGVEEERRVSVRLRRRKKESHWIDIDIDSDRDGHCSIMLPSLASAAFCLSNLKLLTSTALSVHVVGVGLFLSIFGGFGPRKY